MRKFFKGVAKTALKASPIPIPEGVLEQVGLHTDKLTELLDEIELLKGQVEEIVEFIREVREMFEVQGE